MPKKFHGMMDDLKATVESMAKRDEFFNKQLANLLYDIVELRGAPYPQLQNAIIEKMSDFNDPINHNDIRIMIVAFSKYYPARGFVRATLSRFEEIELVQYDKESLIALYKALLIIQAKMP
jgi:hypothetical protein